MRRLDKYYMLVRKFTNAAFRLLIRSEWREDACAEYNSILSSAGGPLWQVGHVAPDFWIFFKYVIFSPTDNRVPSSLAYHLADIYLEELDKAVSSNPSVSIS